MFNFKPISIDDKEIIDRYFYEYGEGSCQHSFVSSYCLSNKYDEQFAFKDDYMYVYRKGKSDENQMTFLFPMGDKNDKVKLKKIIDDIIEFTHLQNKKLVFNTITETSKDLLVDLYGEKFAIEENRDYFEYIYSFDTLANLPGGELASKRYDLKTFARDYGMRFREKELNESHIEEVLKFQDWWVTEKLHGEEDVQLALEDEAIKKGLAHFKELKLKGIITYIDNKIVGYAYGSPLSETYFDVLIEKGNRQFPDIYKVLNRDLVRYCCQSYKYINREEDVGVPGLRKAKMSYKPDMFIKKYIAKEI